MKKVLSIILCILLILPAAGCGSTGSSVMTLGKAEITDKMLVFWLSRYKAQFVYAYGSSVKSTYGVSDLADFWKMTYDEATGQTYDDLFTSYIVENARTYLCAMYLFDEYGLKLSSDEIDDVDEYLDQLVDDYADGSRTEFNTVLAGYGFNYKTLRECYLVDKKVSALQDYLFGTGGPEEITDDTLESYYQENFVRMQQICIFINQCPEKDEDGKYLTGDDGNISYRDMTAAETQDARDRADEALAKLNAGADFSTVMSEYNENTESAEYTNGIYMSADSLYTSGTDLQSIYDAVCEMSVGQYKLVELENSLHIIQKLSLDTGAYKKSANSEFFTFYDSSLGDYVEFREYLKTPLFLDYIEEKLKAMAADVKTDEDGMAEHKISTVTENYYF